MTSENKITQTVTRIEKVESNVHKSTLWDNVKTFFRKKRRARINVPTMRTPPPPPPKNNMPKKLKSLLESEHYSKSSLKIVKINDAYGIRCKSSGKYIDLKTGGHSWNPSDSYFKDCIGTADEVLARYQMLDPIVEQIKIEDL